MYIFIYVRVCVCVGLCVCSTICSLFYTLIPRPLKKKNISISFLNENASREQKKSLILFKNI